MAKYNVDLMLAVREQITSHPETHYQGMWAKETDCGTTYCIAGWATVLSGQQLRWERFGTRPPEAWHVEDATGEPTSIEIYARSALGLSREESDDLFSSHYSEPDALAMLDELIEKGKNQP